MAQFIPRRTSLTRASEELIAMDLISQTKVGKEYRMEFVTHDIDMILILEDKKKAHFSVFWKYIKDEPLSFESIHAIHTKEDSIKILKAIYLEA